MKLSYLRNTLWEKRIGKKIGENMETKVDEELNLQSKAAMEAFQALFSDEKARKSKEQWKDYFLSETFLDVQFSENYMEQTRDYLKKHESDEDYLDDDEEYDDGYEDGEDYLDDNDEHEDAKTV